jgi:hypothetical protein
VHPLLLAAAERQLGVFTAADAARAGHGPDEVRGLLSSGEWVRLRRGIYTTPDRLGAGGRPPHGLECLAVLLTLARPGAVVSHTSAARLLGLQVRRSRERTVRLTDPSLWRTGRGFRIAQAPLTADEVVRRGPVPLTAPARTLVDCAREWPLEEAVIAMDAALLDGLTSPPELRRAVASQHSWRGAPRARRALELADGRAESPLETRGRLRLIGAGLPPDELQVEIRVGGRLVAVADAWYERAAVAIEFDGRVKYTDPWRTTDPARVLWEEKRREDDVRALDIRVVRVAEADLGASWREIENRLRRLLGTPGPAARRFTATPRARGIRRSA